MRAFNYIGLLCAAGVAFGGQAAGKPDIASVAAHPSGGYLDIKLADGRYLVRFAGDHLTDRSQVEDYLLYRAAELTVGEGFDWFEIVQRYTERNRLAYVDPRPFASPWNDDGDDDDDQGSGEPESELDYKPILTSASRYHRAAKDVRNVEQFAMEAEIVMHRGRIRSTKAEAMSAHDILRDMRPINRAPEAPDRRRRSPMCKVAASSPALAPPPAGDAVQPSRSGSTEPCVL